METFADQPVTNASGLVVVAVTSSAGTDSTYAIGDTIALTATFIQAVTVTEAGANPVTGPRIPFTLGAATRHAVYASGSGTTELVFGYTVAEDDEDSDGIAVAANALELNGGAIDDGSSTAAVLTHAAVAASTDHTVDGVRPTVSNASVNGTTLTLTFNETLGAAAKLANGAFTVKKTPAGGTEGTVSLSAGSPPAISDTTVTLTLAAAVTATDTAVKVSYAAPSSGDNNKLADTAGNTVADFTGTAVTNATGPAVTALAVSSDAGTDSTYAIGDTIALTATFDAAVTVTEAGANPVKGPRIAFTLGAATRHAVYASGSGTTELVFGYTVAEGDEDSDGIAVAANALALNGGAIDDGSSNAVTLTHAALAAQSAHTVDGVRPTVAGASVDGAALTLTFSEPLGAAAGLANDAFEVRRTRAGAEQTVALSGTPVISGATVSLTLAESVVSTDIRLRVSYEAPTTGSANALVDAAGNRAADFDHAAVMNASDPTVAVSSSAGADSAYAIGETISLTATFGGTVTVTETTAGALVVGPRIAFTLGDATRHAVYASGSGTAALVFNYTVVAGDEDTDGIAVGADALDLNGAVITDATSNPAVLDHAAVAADPAHKVDGVRPAVTRAIVDGDTIALTWSEALDAGSKPAAADFEVTVAGSPVSLANDDPVSIAGRVLTLTLASAVSPDEEVVRVTWTGDARRLIRDGPGNGATSPVTWTVTNDTTRQPPTFDAGETATFEVEENTAAGTAVGTLAVTSRGGEPAFSLDSAGTDHESFAIDGAGRITVAPGAALDYETKSSYSIVASVTDGEDAAGNPQPPGMETPDDTIAVTITVRNINPPGAPRIYPYQDKGVLRIGDGLDGAIYLRWRRPSGATPVTGYRVHWWQRGDYAGTVTHRDVAALVKGNAWQDYTITGLTNAVVYGVALSAFNSEGQSPLSLPGTDESFFVTPTAGAGLHANRTPRSLRVSAEAAGSLRVRWDAPSNTANHLDGYEIAWTPSTSFTGAPTARVSASARSHTVTDLAGGQAYRLRVSTIYKERSNSDGSYTAPAFASGTALSSPSAVTDLAVTAHDGALRLAWAPPASDGGLPLARYEVRWGAPGETPAGEADVGLVEAYAVTGLTNGETYEVGVRAVNSGADPNPGGTARSFEGAFATATATPNAGPVSADVVKETMVDTEVAFAASDFPFTGAGDTLAAATVVTLPDAAHGTLYFGNPRRAVSAGERFVAGNLDALVFAPASGFAGTASFRFRVEDSHGAESGANTVFVRVLDAPAEPGRSVLGVSLVSDPGADATYAAGDTIRVRATFTGSITLSAGADRPSVKLELVDGAASVERTATYAGGDGTSSLELTYEVAAGDEAPDGVGIVANSLGGVEDTSTASAADLTHAAVAADTGHKVDGVAPTLAGAPALVSTPSAGDTYGRGEFVDVALTFSEPVAVNGAPRLAVRVGAETRQAVYRAGGGTATLTFRYTLVLADEDADGISIPAGTLALAGGAITDLPGNAAPLAYTALAAQPGHKVKGNSAPVANAGGDLTVRPGEEVTLDGSGSTDADGDELTWAWTQTAGTTVTLDNATVARPGFTAPATTDYEALEFSLTVSDGTATSAPDTVTVAVDATSALAVESVSITSTPAADRDRDGRADTYAVGGTIALKATFNVAVTVGTAGGTPRIAFTLGDATKHAAYHSGSGTAALEFRYTVAEGDEDSDGIAVGANALALDGGTITDAAANAATLTHAAVAASTDHQVDGVRPTVSSASVSGATLTLIFDETLGAAASLANGAFTVKKTPQGGSEQTVSLSGTPSISGDTVTLTLASAVVATDTDVKVSYTVPSSGTDNTLRDAAGNGVKGFARTVDANAAPRFPSTAPAEFGVAENNAAGAPVGVVAATDLDGDTLTYTLDSASDAVFDIDGAGAITVADAGALDHEATPSWSVTVSVSDGRAPDGSADPGVDATHGLTVTVTDVAEPPDAPTGVTVVSTESYDGLTVSWNAPDTTGIPPITDYDVRYFEGSADPDSETRWVEPDESGGHDHVGAETSTTIGRLFSERSYRVQVRATNDEGKSAWSESGLGVTAPVWQVTGVALGSKPRIDADGDSVNDTYGRGQAIAVDVTWTRPVTWDVSASGAEILVRLDVGGTIREAELATGGDAGGTATTLRFLYTVVQGDVDTDGVAVTPAGDGSLVVLRNGATLLGAAGRAVGRDHAGLTAQANHKVDGKSSPPENRAPQCTATQEPGDDPESAPPGVRITSVVASCTDPDGDALAFTVGVDRPALFAVSHVKSGSTVQVGLDTPEVCVLESVTPALPNPLLTTVTQTGTDPDGATASATARFTTSFAGCPFLQSATVDGVTLTLTYSRTLDTKFVPDAIDLEVRVNGTLVTVATGDDDVKIMGKSVVVTLAETVLPGQQVTMSYYRDGDSDIRTDAGVRALALTEHEVTNVTPPPSVAGVTLVSTPTADTNGDGTNDTYKVGDVVRARVTFSAAVTVTEAGANPVTGPRIALTVGDATRHAVYASGSGTAELEFRYTVAEDDEDTDGIAVGADALELNGGTIADAASNAAVLTHTAVAASTDHKVDGVRPTVESALVDGATLTLTFAEALDTTAAPDKSAFTVSGTASATSVTAVAFKAGDATKVELTVSPAVAGETGITLAYTVPSANPLEDVPGNAVAAFTGQAVTNAAVAVVTVSSSAGTDSTYAIGDVIALTATFAEAMTVTAAGSDPVVGPRIAFTVGDATRHAVYASGSGTTELVFSYTVAAGDEDTDGIAVAANALALNGGTIADSSSNPATLIHAALAAQSAHKVDGVRPTVSSASVSGTTLTLTFAEALDTTTAPDKSAFTVSGTASATSVTAVAFKAGDATQVELTVDPAVGAAETGITLGYTVPSGDGANPLEDVPGNEVAAFTGQAVTNAAVAAVTGVTVSSDAGDDDTYAIGETIALKAAFSRSVTVTTAETAGWWWGRASRSRWAARRSTRCTPRAAARRSWCSTTPWPRTTRTATASRWRRMRSRSTAGPLPTGPRTRRRSPTRRWRRTPTTRSTGCARRCRARRSTAPP